jgi:hypothetical protein
MAGCLAAAAVFAASAAGFPTRGAQPNAAQPNSTAAADPSQPFRISGPNTDPENLAGAEGLENLAPETDLVTIRTQMPATRTLAPTDLVRFRLTAAVGRKNSNGFASATYYRDDVQRQLLSIGAWNKIGDFNLVVALNSPVFDYKQTTIDGLPALTILPSANIVGGLAPRTAYLYHAGIIYVVHGEGFLSDNSFMSVVHNFIAEVTK